MDETSELERLRARVAELESELKATEGAQAPSGVILGTRSAWWSVLSAALIVVGAVLAPLSVASVWASRTLSDTSRYVETVAPIARDPGVQQALANKITSVIFENLDIRSITSQALTTLAQQRDLPPRVAAALPGLSVPIANGVESFTQDQVDKFVASPQFAQLWDQVNRVAHEQVVRLLEGEQGGAITAQDNTITLNLAPIIATVKDRLVAQGFGLASNIPAVDTSFVLVESEGITKAQGTFSLLNTLGVWLPFIALALIAGGVFLARDRRRALTRASLGVALAMIILGLGLAVTRMWYVSTTPGNVLTEQSAGYVFDTLVRFLRTGLRAVAVLGIVFALAAFLAGPSPAAVRTRATFAGGIGSARGSAEAAGWNPGRIGTWTYAHRRALWIALAAACGLVLMFWSQPTGWVVVWTAIVAVLVLAIIEFLARPPVPSTLVPATADVAPAGAPGAAPQSAPVAQTQELPQKLPQQPIEQTQAATEQTQDLTRS